MSEIIEEVIEEVVGVVAPVPRVQKVRHTDGCVTETSLLALTKCQKWEATIKSDMGKEVRTFFLFNLEQLDKKEMYLQKVLIDKITGTIYDFATGVCLSSTRLKILRKKKKLEPKKKVEKKVEEKVEVRARRLSKYLEQNPLFPLMP